MIRHPGVQTALRDIFLPDVLKMHGSTVAGIVLKIEKNKKIKNF